MDTKTVLIADDEEDVVESVRFNLDLEGIRAIGACDGEEALARAKKEKPDLIILDVMMPKMNGYKVARLLKFDDAFKKIPVIMLTARTQDKDIKIGLETGADKYIAKPFDMDELMGIVKGFLENRTSREVK